MPEGGSISVSAAPGAVGAFEEPSELKRIRAVLLALIVIVLVLAAIVLLVLQMPIFGGSFEGARLARMQRAEQYHGDRFENVPPQEGYDFEKTKIMIGNYLGDQIREPQFAVPVDRITPASFEHRRRGLRAWWFGHSSVLIEIDAVLVMTDPVFAERASPLSFAGPKRFHPVPLALDRMPEVDVVVISHDHFDHLDMVATQAIAARGAHFYVGLGVGAHLERWGVEVAQIRELNWWESAKHGALTIHATPARHYSGRKSMDNSTLWTSWVIKSANHSVFYTGDTGYSRHFREIGERLGPIDLSLTKVGAYGQSWLDIHMDPEMAVQSHIDVRARVLLPLHWATFNMSYHAWDEPIVRTLRAAKAKHVTVVTPRVGQMVEFGQPFDNEHWWRD